jgi:hypothetical protein
MAERLPLLLFPKPGISGKDSGRRFIPPRMHWPSADRQRERLGPKFAELQSAFDARRIQLQATAPQDDPELVVVFETIGSISSFVGAVKRIPGLEWLLEADELDIEADDDFFDTRRDEKSLTGSLFLLGTNRQALAEIVSLWRNYLDDPSTKFERGFGAWMDVFKHLRDVRFWGAKDRLGQDIIDYWNDHLAAGDDAIRFEIEAWCFASQEKNQRAAAELTRLIGSLGGRILRSALITEIAYHGFLVELPADGVRQLLSDSPPELVLSDRVMFFRPRGQAIAPAAEDAGRHPAGVPPSRAVSGVPVVALLDGLPLQNHPMLAGRLTIDDPDGWEATYPAEERVHGTAMASLIAMGELDGPRLPLGRPIYVRPIMRPDPTSFRTPRTETTPGDTLLIDLVHRAVRRIFEGEGDAAAAAPTVRVINLSVGAEQRPFDSALSPWARLLDWLSYRYRVLFVVSAGNASANLTLETPRESLSSLPVEERQRLAMQAVFADSMRRRLLAPAEAINVITVGAVHADASTPRTIPNRFDLFPHAGVSPYSAIGHGFRRGIKPDVVLPGGRALHKENYSGSQDVTQVSLVSASTAPPGHRVAVPPGADGSEAYSRGTSNATALASRGAAQAFDVIEALRSGHPQLLSDRFDAVLLKALLAHGADWGDLERQILDARSDITDRRKQQDFVARFVGYGLADIDRALTCTEQRATLIGVGELKNDEALEFRAPLPPCISAQTIKRRLTITLAWLTPVNVRNSKYRSARLWIDPPKDAYGVSRANCEWRHVRRGTLQHEVLEGQDALAFVDGKEVVFKVNCSKDASTLSDSVPFALCVSLEVAEGLTLPIYQEIRDRVSIRVGVQP